jgi:tRNA(Ile)-lysidine synthase
MSETSTAELLERVRRGGLLEPGEAVVVCLSGGRDSVCLLDIAVELCGRASVTALHVNYGLRDEAGRDEELCRDLCQRLGVELTVESATAPR